MNLRLLHAWPVSRYPDHTAIVFKDRRLTFREIDARVSRLANALLALGLGRGDKAAVLMNNRVELVESLFGIARAGLAVIDLNARQSAQEHIFLLNDSEADAVIVGADLMPIMEQVLPSTPKIRRVIVVGDPGADHLNYEELLAAQPETWPDVVIDANDVDRIHYTSGTTGKPKGAVSTFQISYNRLIGVLLNMDRAISPADVNLNIGPLTHAAGLMMNTYYIRGARNIILDKFDPDLVLQTIERERVTAVLLIPTMLNFLLLHPRLKAYDLSSVQRVWYGTAPMAPERLREAIQVFGNVLRQNYGMSECPQPITYLGPEDHILDGTEAEQRRLSSAGKPAMGMDVRIVNEDGSEVRPGEIGEILLKSNQMMKEYWRNPQATAEVFRDGWLHTGDMATVDQDGYIYIMDRKHDMIISGGFNIYPREVEDVLMAHPEVAAAAAVGVPDDVWGESVKAFVVTKGGRRLSEEELIGFCKQNLASYKKPKSVEFVADLPRNAYGKVLRKTLKEPFWRGRERKV